MDQIRHIEKKNLNDEKWHGAIISELFMKLE